MTDKIDTSIAAVTALMQDVTEGPWVTQRDPSHFDTESIIIGGGSVVAHSYAGYPAIEANARFIAAARDLVPALLAERDALAHDIERIKDSETDAINRAEAAEAALKEAVEAVAAAVEVADRLNVKTPGLKYSGLEYARAFLAKHTKGDTN